MNSSTRCLLVTFAVGLVLALGLGLGGGLAYLMEMMDTSYKTPDEVEQELQMPVLVSIPIRFSKKKLRKRFMVEFLKASSVAVQRHPYHVTRGTSEEPRQQAGASGSSTTAPEEKAAA